MSHRYVGRISLCALLTKKINAHEQAPASAAGKMVVPFILRTDIADMIKKDPDFVGASHLLHPLLSRSSPDLFNPASPFISFLSSFYSFFLTIFPYPSSLLSPLSSFNSP